MVQYGIGSTRVNIGIFHFIYFKNENNTSIFFIETRNVKEEYWTLREKCPYSELFWSFGLNTERYEVRRYEVLNTERSKCGKIRTRINLNADTFYAVELAELFTHTKGRFDNNSCYLIFRKHTEKLLFRFLVYKCL